GLRHERTAVFVLRCVDAGRDTAGVEPLGDLDQLHHRIAQIAPGAGIEAVRLAHERAGADQQVAEAGSRRDTAMTMVSCVAVGQHMAVLPVAGVEDALPGNEDPVEDYDGSRLPVLARKERIAVLELLARAACRAGDDGNSWSVDTHGAADRELLV